MNRELETKKEMLRTWVNQYINKFEEKGLDSQVQKYKYLNCAIDFATIDKSIEKVEHLFNLRSSIEKHIQAKNFDKNYKKLNEKLIYNMEKNIEKILLIDLQIEESPNLSRVAVFDQKDLEIATFLGGN